MEEIGKIKSNIFEYTFLDNGDWLYKAVPLKKLKPIEKPQINVVNEIEKHYLEYFEKRVVGISRDIAKYLL